MLAPHDTAAALLARYAVWGKYYGLELQGKSLPMRSHLELFSHDINPERAITATPDAVAVMMNPGGSQPLPSMETIRGYAPAKPDTTQYQLMRVMQAVNWQHVRVLNLSDFRAPKSKDFLAFLKQYAGDDAHSMFSPARSAELADALGACPCLILGWGVQTAFEPWAQRVLKAAAGKTVFGQQGQQAWVYKHPLPLAQPAAQLQWVQDIAAQVKAHQTSAPS